MNPKFWRTELKADDTTVCPWCSETNNHKTGNVCEHVAKVTVKRVAFYFWGFRPLKEAA